MKNYYRVMLGHKSRHIDRCLAGNFIGAQFDMDMDLTGKIPEEWRKFNHEFISLFLAKNSGKTKIGAGVGRALAYIATR